MTLGGAAQVYLRGGEFEGISSVHMGLKVVKLFSVGHFLFTCPDTFAVGCK